VFRERLNSCILQTTFCYSGLQVHVDPRYQTEGRYPLPIIRLGRALICTVVPTINFTLLRRYRTSGTRFAGPCFEGHPWPWASSHNAPAPTWWWWWRLSAWGWPVPRFGREVLLRSHIQQL